MQQFIQTKKEQIVEKRYALGKNLKLVFWNGPRTQKRLMETKLLLTGFMIYMFSKFYCLNSTVYTMRRNLLKNNVLHIWSGKNLLKYGSQVIIPFWYKCSIFLSLFLCLKNNDVAKNVNLNINLWCLVPGTV